MTAHYCPDCGLFEVSIRKPGKDGRCDWCRSQIGRRRTEPTPRRGYDHDELLTRLGRTR
jgi:hypothetical protein